jgi:dienelactone hydrolase
LVGWLRAADRGVAAAAGGGGRATSWGARVACARYLQSRRDVVSGPIACLGLSGGGCRAELLHAACEEMAGAGVMGMMTTHPALLDRPVDKHTWMFFAPGLASNGDWPDVAAARAPVPLLVQFNRDDQLFTPQGMSAAHNRVTTRYRQAGAPGALRRRVLRRPAQVRHRNAAVRLAHPEQWLRE